MLPSNKGSYARLDNFCPILLFPGFFPFLSLQLGLLDDGQAVGLL
jgi:hypothetical protein